MSITLTPNYQLKKPDVNTEIDVWGPHLNDNWDTVDGKIKIATDAAITAGTPPNNSITDAKLADMPANTIKGAVVAGDPVNLNGTQATTILNTFTPALKGLVPPSGVSSTTNFLSAAGTWIAPATGGGSVGDDSVTNAKLANMPANTVKARRAGIGDPEDLTVPEAMLLLGAAPLNSPDFTGAPTVIGAPPAALTNNTQIATCAHVYESVTEEQANPKTVSYALVSTDAGRMVTFNSASAVNCQVDNNIFVANARVDIMQLGGGQVTFTGSVTSKHSRSGFKLAGQYAAATLWFISPTEYVLFGDTVV